MPGRSQSSSGNSDNAKTDLPGGSKVGPGLVFAVSCAFILVFGFVLNNVVVEYAKKHESRHLLEYVNAMTPGLDPGHVARLTGTTADLDNPYFRSIKAYLANVRAVSPDYRFVYLMAKQGENIVFIADAEDETSPDYSAPGEIYDEASEQLFQIFTDGKSFIEGPIIDSYGEWVSVHAPVINPEKGTVAAIIGIDISAKRWDDAIMVYRLFSAAITLLMALVSAVLFVFYLRATRDSYQIGMTNKYLEDSLAKVRLLEGIIPICMYCKKIRDDQESWKRVEEYIGEHSEAKFSHGVCPECFDKQIDEMKRAKLIDSD
jgi:hypothetical protein